jgi:translation initiation factor IF-2
VAGSLEAIEDEIAKLPQQEVKVNIIHRGVGGINESDVMLAAASEGVILAFNVRPVGDARQIAEREGVEIRSYAVIYRAIESCATRWRGCSSPPRSRPRSARPRCASLQSLHRHDRRLFRD